MGGLLPAILMPLGASPYSPITGPFCVEKVQSYTPFAQAFQGYAAGENSKVSSYSPGTAATQTACS